MIISLLRLNAIIRHLSDFNFNPRLLRSIYFLSKKWHVNFLFKLTFKKKKLNFYQPVSGNIVYLDTDLPVTSGLAGSTHKTIESSSSSPTPTPTIEGTHSRVLQTRSSSHEASWATPSSITSNTSTDSGKYGILKLSFPDEHDCSFKHCLKNCSRVSKKFNAFKDQ